MGLLDDAIREHLELKRRHGADPTEVARQEREALGAAQRAAAERAAAEREPGAALRRRCPTRRRRRPTRRRGLRGARAAPGPRAVARSRGRRPDPTAPIRERAEPPPRRRRPPRGDDASVDVDRARASPMRASRRPAADDEPRTRTSSRRPRSSSRRRPSTTGSGSSSGRPRTSTSDVAAPAGLPLTWLDVFTVQPPDRQRLAVVHDADGVDDATMLAFARETRLSETTFVQTATRRRRRLPQPHLDDVRRARLRRPSVARHRGRGRACARGEERASLRPADAAPACSRRRRAARGRRRAGVDAPGARRVRRRARPAPTSPPRCA